MAHCPILSSYAAPKILTITPNPSHRAEVRKRWKVGRGKIAALLIMIKAPCSANILKAYSHIKSLLGSLSGAQKTPLPVKSPQMSALLDKQ